MKNIGSIIAIQYALASDIESITTPDDNFQVDIGFKSGKSLQDFNFTPETAAFNEEEQQNDAGPYFGQGLSFKAPKIGTDLYAIQRELIDQDLILVITDGNGLPVVMGTLEAPARMSVRMLRPSSPGGYNGYEFSFRCNAREAAPFLHESFVLS